MPNITGANEYLDIPAVAPRIGGVLSVANVIPATGHSLLGVEFQSDACAVGGTIDDFCAIDPAIGLCVPPPPDPTITSLNPNTLPASAAATLITVTGTLFEAGSVVEVNQVAQATTFVNSTTLTIMYDPTAAGTAEFTVRNPNNEESNSVPFTITAALFDPSAHTIDEIKDYIDALPDEGNNHPETQRVLDAERDGQARVTLLAWLDSKEGMI